MGASSSNTATAADISDYVSKLGNVFDRPAKKIRELGISGLVLADFSNDDIETFVMSSDGLGISNAVQAKVLKTHLKHFLKNPNVFIDTYVSKGLPEVSDVSETLTQAEPHNPLSALYTSAQISDYISDLGSSYQPTAKKLAAVGIDGLFLSECGEAELQNILSSEGNITNLIQMKVLSKHLGLFRAFRPDNKPSTTTNAPEPLVKRPPRIVLRREGQAHTGPVNCVAELSGDRIATGCTDNTIQVWNISKDAAFQEFVLKGHISAVTCLLALTDDLLVSGSRDNTLRVWNVAAILEGNSMEANRTDSSCVVALAGHQSAVTSLCQLTAGSGDTNSYRIASGSWDKTIRIWSIVVAANRKHWQCEAVLLGLPSFVNCILELSDGRIAGASWDNALHVWEVPMMNNRSPTKAKVLTSPSLALEEGVKAQSKEENYVKADVSPKVDVKAEAKVGTTDNPKSDTKTIGSKATAAAPARQSEPPRGGFSSSTKSSRDIDIKYPAASIDGQSEASQPRIITSSILLEDLTGRMNVALQLRDGLLAVGTTDCFVRLLSLTDGFVRVFRHEGGVNSLCELTDGRLASASDDGTIRVWNLTKRKQDRILRGHSDRVNGVIQLSDGSLASVSSDGSARIWAVNEFISQNI